VKTQVDSTYVAIAGAHYQYSGSTGTKHYYAGNVRVAERVGGTLYWLLSDHLGSTAVTTNASGGNVAELRYYAYGKPRYNVGGQKTDYRFTGQRWQNDLGIYWYNSRWYDQLTGRFLQPDTIVPNPGNPQALNRYSYATNNPLRFIDPSGHDPLDAAWQEEFYTNHGREPTAEDMLIRLFSLAFPDQWNWSSFYDKEGNYISGSIENVFRDNRPVDWNWNDVPGALEKMSGWYKAGEEGLFTRDIGSLFGGLTNRFETPETWGAVSNRNNPIRTWVYLDRDGLSSSLMGTSDDDANVHHWAWALTMGAAYGPGGSMLNTSREITQFRGDWRNTWSDISIGNRGAALGVHFRILGLTDITRAWNFFMLDRWF